MNNLVHRLHNQLVSKHVGNQPDMVSVSIKHNAWSGFFRDKYFIYALCFHKNWFENMRTLYICTYHIFFCTGIMYNNHFSQLPQNWIRLPDTILWGVVKDRARDTWLHPRVQTIVTVNVLVGVLEGEHGDSLVKLILRTRIRRGMRVLDACLSLLAPH